LLDTFLKLRALLSPREKRQALLLLAMMLVLGMVEMAGVASIFPLIAVLSNPGLVESNEWLKLAYDTLGFTSLNAFFIFLSAAVFALIVVRTLFTALTSYGLLRYAQMRSHGLSVRLLGSYLRRPYAFFLNRHSADMGKTVLSEVDQVIGGSLMPALQLVSQTIIASFIIAVVVFMDPLVAAIALVGIIGAYGLVYVAIRNYLRRKGQERIAANKERFRIAQEVLAGVKEVKIGGLERGYLRRFETASLRFSRLRTQLNLVRDVPRHMLELIAIGGILAVILVLLFRADGNLSAALPTMAVYAFAGLRLLPAIQALYQAVVALRFGGPALDALCKDLFEADHATTLASASPLPLNREIKLHDVSFTYAEVERQALQNVSLTIPAHSTVGFFGATGAGKSTIIDIILGLLEPSSGVMTVDGIAITRERVRSWQRSVGYVPQQIFLADESVAANIALGVPPSEVDMAAVERAARMASLHDFIASELPKGYETEVGDRGVRLSGGQRQRIGIARALYHDPEVLILDEATSALDIATEHIVMSGLAAIGGKKTVILIAHRLQTLEGCETIFEVDKGRILASGSYEQLIGGPMRRSETTL
jgi:ABC-type multidrug transport system fused ATPase/permease subunit